MQDFGDPRNDPARGNATDKVEEETGSAGPSYVGQGEEDTAEAALPTVSQYPTTDQMLRSQAMEYATRNGGGGDILERSQKYYDFLKGSAE